MSMDGGRDPRWLLAQLRPSLDPETYVFACRPHDAALPPGLAPLARIRETEGETLVVTRAAAAAHGLDGLFPCRRITLTVHSALDAVGLLAAVSGALAEAGIPANTLSATCHDHLFVPTEAAERALDVLRDLSAQASRAR